MPATSKAGIEDAGEAPLRGPYRGRRPEAIRVISERDIDVVTLDSNMPGLSGIAALKEIKKSGRKRKLSSSPGTDRLQMLLKSKGLEDLP